MRNEPAQRSELVEAVAFVAVWLPYAWLVRKFWFLADDAYISFRYARNWAHGAGVRYNLGDHAPVEGYSNFLLVAVAALFERLGWDLELAVPVLCAACGSVLLYVVFRALVDRLEVGLPVAVLATALLGCSAQFVVWSSSGMETMPFALLVFLLYERLILRRGGIAPISGGVLALLLALTRPEGICWALGIGALAAISRRRDPGGVRRPLALWLAILATGFGAYLAWRFAVYNALLPNTVAAKAGTSAGHLERGFSYVAVQYLTSLSLFAVVPGLLVAFRRERRAVALPAAAIALGFVAFSILVSGDFMTFGRFLVPALAFHALLAAWLLFDVWRLGVVGRGAATLAGLGLVALGLLPAWNAHLVPQDVRERFAFRANKREFSTEYERWHGMRALSIERSATGKALAALAGPGDSVVIGAIGAVGYHSNLFVFDQNGLVTPEVGARETGDAAARSPGHDKYVGYPYFLEAGYEPTFIKTRLMRTMDRAVLQRQFVSDRRILERSKLADRYVAEYHLIQTSGGDDDAPGLLLSVWRRIPDGAVPSEVWADRAAHMGNVPTVEMEPFPMRVGGVPAWF